MMDEKRYGLKRRGGRDRGDGFEENGGKGRGKRDSNKRTQQYVSPDVYEHRKVTTSTN